VDIDAGITGKAGGKMRMCGKIRKEKGTAVQSGESVELAIAPTIRGEDIFNVMKSSYYW